MRLFGIENLGGNMYTLTERRFKKAEIILEKYREQMLEYGKNTGYGFRKRAT